MAQIMDIRRMQIEPFPTGQPPRLSMWQESLTHSRFPTIASEINGVERRMLITANGNRLVLHPDLERELIGNWEAVLRWVAKLKWRSPNLQLPRIKQFQTLKPQAEVLLALLNLCLELHGIGYGEKYRNAGEWWKFLAWEFQAAMRSDYYLGTDLLIGDSRSRYARSIKKGQNPFPESLPYLQEIAIAAISCKDNHRAIFVDLYKGKQRQIPHKGLGVALSNWETHMVRSPHRSIAFDGSNILTNGKNGISVLAYKDRPLKVPL